MKKISVLILFVLTAFSIPKSEVSIHFPHKIGIVQACPDSDPTFELMITTESKVKIPVFDFDLNVQDLKILRNGKEVSFTDSLYFNAAKPLKLKMQFRNVPGNQVKTLNFKTKLPAYASNRIQLEYGKFYVRTEQVTNKENLVFDISNSCMDSIKVFFGAGGTMTSVSLFKNSHSQKPYKSVTFHLGDEPNYLYLSKKDIGNYNVSYRACHWGGDFKITVK